MRALLIAIWAAAAAAQTPPAFDFADVHASPRSADPESETFRSGRYEAHQINMVQLIASAYGVWPESILGGPSWLEADRFDVIARMPVSTSQDTTRLMLQTLLADRFKLAIRKDTKSMPAFALTIGKGKPKMKEADGTGEIGCRPQRPTDARPYALFVCRNVTMADLVERLQMSAGAYFNYRVVNLTGLAGKWDFEVGWSPRATLERSGDGVSVFQAIDRQLGLTLEQKDVPMAVIIVEHVNEKPTDNPPGLPTKLSPPMPREFEVASLKLSAPGELPGGPGLQSGGRLDFRHFPLRGLIALAWNVRPGNEIAGLPKWVDSTFVDVIAKTSVDRISDRVPMEDLAPMLRKLLEVRFHVQSHYEDRPVDAYSLIAWKPKLRKADPGARTKCTSQRMTASVSGPPSAQVSCQNMTMAQFADELPRIAPAYLHYGAPDKTGIEGAWDFSFIFALSPTSSGGGGRKGSAAAAPSADIAPDPSGAMSLFDALTHQLGLKLELEKRPAPVLVIDRIDETPVQN